MSRFDGKVALVTGAGAGIGEAIATRLIKDGARVVLADISGRQDEVAASLGDHAVARRVDVSEQESVLELEAWIRSEYGGLDILSNNAGILNTLSPMHETPIDAWDKVMSVNVRGAFMVLQSGVRLMLESGGGAVVNTASIGGFRATAGSSAYITSKGAMVMLTRVAALDYAQKGIRVNAVAPGITRSGITDASSQEVLDFLLEQIPQGRLGEPSDVANIVAFLADDNETPHVTGQIWVVDGGRSAG